MDLVEANFNIDQRHPWELARLSMAKRLIRKISLGPGLVLLDVGSGDAFIGQSLSNMIPNTQSHCVDIEYTESLKRDISDAYKNENLHLYSSLSEFSDKNIDCDIVTLMDVIEHVPDDVKFLKQIISDVSIKPETKFLITVPAYQGLFTRHDVILKHYRRYTLDQLKASCSEAGLKFISGGYFFTLLLIPRLITWAAEKLRVADKDKHQNLGNWQGGPLLSKIIEWLLLMDIGVNSFLNKMGFTLPGLSCYAIVVLNLKK